MSISAAHSTAPKFRPRRHQQQAIDAVAAEFASDATRANVVMMCGTGKTLTGQRLTERLIEERIVPETGRVLLLFPSLALIAQTFQGWAEQQERPFRAIAFCSGEPVKATSRGTKDEVGLDSLDQDMDSTTDPDVLAKWLLHEDASDTLSVVLGTYHSSPRIADMHAAFDVAPWDLVLFDEAHNTTGDLTSPFATALHEDNVPAARRVFMTATPKVHKKRGRKVANASDDGIASMNDETVYGRQVFSYPLPAAVADGVLTDYEVVIMAVSEPDVLDYVADHPDVFDTSSEKAATLAQAEALAAIATFRAARQYDLHRLLTFHATVEASENFSAHLPLVLDSLDEVDLPAGVTRDAIQFLTVKGADTAARRAEVKTLLGGTANNALTVLSNCKVFAEGVDVPTLDGLVMADARRSPTEVTQIVGRIIRRNDMRQGKSVLVLPVVVTPGEEPHSMLETGTFEKVWQTLIALAEHDMTMATDLAKAARRRAQDEIGPLEADADREAARLDDSTRPDLTKITFVGVDGARAPSDIVRAFEMLAVERAVETWDKSLARCEAQTIALGRNPAQGATDPQERQSAIWITRQRVSLGKNLLSPERISALDVMSKRTGVPWNETLDDVWEQNRARCEELTVAFGRSPRMESSDPGEKKSGAWLGTQRAACKNATLTDERAAALDAMSKRTGVPWNRANDVVWEQSRVACEKQTLALGRNPSRKASDPDEKRSSTWLFNQRNALRTGRLTDVRAAALDAMSERTGVPWNETLDDVWEQNRAQCEKQTLALGRNPSKNAPDPQEKTSGTWLGVQRAAVRKGTLTDERAAALDAMSERTGVLWNETLDDVWEQNRAQCEKQTLALGRNPSREVTDSREKKAGEWLRTQRQAIKTGQLSAERIAALDGMSERTGVPWNHTFHDVWEQHRAACEVQMSALGRSPSTMSADPREKQSGAWLSVQRKGLRKGTLSAERTAALDAMSTRTGVLWNLTSDAAWEQSRAAYESQAAALGRNPSPKAVDPDEKRSGIWLSVQRKACKGGTLAAERLAALDAMSERVGVDWHPRRHGQAA